MLMIKKLFSKKYIKNTVAGMMVVIMAAVDMSVWIANAGGDMNVVYEDHEMEEYLADGIYGGRTDSSYEIPSDDDAEIETADRLYHFNILEITRGEGLGTFGYSLSGYEPVPADTPEMKHAMMDALINRVTGGPDDNITKNELPQSVSNFMTQFSDGEKVPFSTSFGPCTGYYKYVGDGNGYYSEVKTGPGNSSTYTDRSNHKARMVSKFFKGNQNINYTPLYSDRKNDYIWVDTNLTVAQMEETTSGIDKTTDIIVSNHRKIKYTNNDVFFKNFYSPESGVTLDEWKNNHKISLRTRVCAKSKESDQVVTDDDIQWADIIYLTNGNGTYAQAAYTLYQEALGSSLPDRNNLPHLDLPTFKMTLDIYDRIAVKEDCAIIVDGKDSFTGGKISTNYMKLIAMLFLVNKNDDPDGTRYGSGRCVFMDFLKKYVTVEKNAPGLSITAVSNRYNGLTAENGYMYQDFPRTWVKKTDSWDDTASYYFDNNGNRIDQTCYLKKSKSNTTDYIYIDQSTGNFMVSTDNSGMWYEVDYEIYNNGQKQTGFARRCVSWDRQGDKLAGKNNSVEWPWDIEGGCLKWWWFEKGVCDQNCHLPIYFQYYGWGPYRAINDPEQGTYKNQSFSQENGAFKGDLVKNAVANRKKKREYEDEHSESRIGAKKYFFLSVNIKNGDGVNKNDGGNKVMYINDYEMPSITSVPIDFSVRTSENISKIQVLKKTKTRTGWTYSDVLTYVPKNDPDTNDITDITKTLEFKGGSGVVLSPEDSSEPDVDVTHHNLKIYTYSGSIASDLKKDPNFKTGANNRFVLRVFVQATPGGEEKYVEDEICIVKRDFFNLE